MKLLFLSTLFLIILTAFCYKASLVKIPELRCTLVSDKKVYKIGEVPKLKVEIVNESDKNMCVIGSLDGSDLKWRRPYCFFMIKKPKPDTVIFSRCGNTNPLRKEDFRIIKPNEKFNPYQDVDHYGFFEDYATRQKETFRNPGVYKIQFHYSTNSENLRDFMGKFEQWERNSDTLKIKHLFAKVPKIDLVSNEIEIIFED